MTPKRYTLGELGIQTDGISKLAVDICRTLQQAGFDGFLVGGCVRDWLMGKEPKDFDVVSNARPEQIRALFRSSRIIGRRFRLVHVRKGREVIEVATYRSPPDDDSHPHHEKTHKGRLTKDNVFGTLEDDAYRRDFTANALYYDPISHEVLDFLGGVEDIGDHNLKQIGQAKQRFHEDPVRMLRAIRFIAKLGFKLEAPLSKTLRDNVGLMRDVSNARLYDETFKMFHHAHAVESWEQLSVFGMRGLLFPLTEKELKKPDSRSDQFILRALKNTDTRVRQDKPVIPAYFFAVILWHAYQSERAQHNNLPRGQAGVQLVADKVFAKQYPTIAIPRRIGVVIAEIWDFQWHLENRRPKSIPRLLEERRFRAAYDFLCLRAEIDEVDPALVAWWTKIQDVSQEQRQQMIQALAPQTAGRKRPRKRRSRKRTT